MQTIITSGSTTKVRRLAKIRNQKDKKLFLRIKKKIRIKNKQIITKSILFNKFFIRLLKTLKINESFITIIIIKR
jgi:hypothetical protein